MTAAANVTDPAGPTASTLRRIAATDVHVTALALGGGPIGGLFTPVPHEQAVATVRAAREQGIGYVDTAPHHGSGRSELAIAEALRQSPCTLSTKVGRRLRPVEPGTVDAPRSSPTRCPTSRSGTGAPTASAEPWKTP
jgi:aryl-alcohol dehydrogenase-like predicted oxidoreductase